MVLATKMFFLHNHLLDDVASFDGFLFITFVGVAEELKEIEVKSEDVNKLLRQQ